MVPVTTTVMIWLLQAYNHVISVKQEQVGIERCKRQCARYNKCYGIEYNPATVTCRILNNRHTDGDVMLLSRKDILQSISIVPFDVAPPRYESLQRIVSKKGHVVDISAQMQSEEIYYVQKIFNLSSLHNCQVMGENFGSVPHSGLQASFCTGMSQAFIPGKIYLTAFRITYPKLASQLVFTFAFSSTQIFHGKGTNWNITYVTDSFGRSLVAHYHGPRSHVTKNIHNSGTSIVPFVSFLIDRSAAGDVLHDTNFADQTIRGSIKGLNLNQPVWLAVQVHSYKGMICPSPNLLGYKNDFAKRSLQQWYKKPNI